MAWKSQVSTPRGKERLALEAILNGEELPAGVGSGTLVKILAKGWITRKGGKTFEVTLRGVDALNPGASSSHAARQLISINQRLDRTVDRLMGSLTPKQKEHAAERLNKLLAAIKARSA